MKALPLILLLALVCCTQRKRPEPLGDKTQPSPLQTEGQEDKQPLPQNNDSTIYVRFLPDSTATTMAATLQKNSPVNFYVDVQSGKKLKATLQLISPKLNARINQLFTPSGKADGPFGSQLDYPIIERGMYKIIVGRNLMAEGLPAGDFSLRVSVEL